MRIVRRDEVGSCEKDRRGDKLSFSAPSSDVWGEKCRSTSLCHAVVLSILVLFVAPSCSPGTGTTRHRHHVALPRPQQQGQLVAPPTLPLLIPHPPPPKTTPPPNSATLPSRSIAAEPIGQEPDAAFLRAQASATPIHAPRPPHRPRHRRADRLQQHVLRPADGMDLRDGDAERVDWVRLLQDAESC